MPFLGPLAYQHCLQLDYIQPVLTWPVEGLACVAAWRMVRLSDAVEVEVKSMPEAVPVEGLAEVSFQPVDSPGWL